MNAFWNWLDNCANHWRDPSQTSKHARHYGTSWWTQTRWICLPGETDRQPWKSFPRWSVFHLILNNPMALIFATRSSALARAQTAQIIRLLQAAQPDLECRERIIPTK